MKKTRFFPEGVFILITIGLLLFFVTGNCMAKEYKFGIAQGWVEYESGQHMKQGYVDGLKDFGGKGTFVSAKFNPQTQSQQIEAFINAKVDAIFITPCDTIAIAPAVNRALKAGIPVFASDSLVTGAACTTSILSNNFGMGAYAANFIAERLKGKGKVAAIRLPTNETWDSRTFGMRWAFKQYPDIQVVYEWVFNPGADVSPREGAELILTRFPEKGSLDAIWCGWDGGAMAAALAIKAAGREKEIFSTGIDGGVEAYTYVKDTSMELSMAQSMWLMTYQAVYYAHQYLEGKKVPRLVISPVYAVTKEKLKNIKNLKEIEYIDKPGVAKKFGFKRCL